MPPAPSFGTPLSLYRTPLGDVLPAEPTGEVLEQGFKPQLTDARPAPSGDRRPARRRRPRTRRRWGRWFRQVDAEPPAAATR